MTRKFLVPVVLPADPAAAMEAATKQYVDAKSAGGGLPVGGAINQVLAKNSATNYDTKWATPLVQADVDARVVAVGDPRYVNTSGDTISGTLGVTGSINSNGQIYTNKTFPGAAPIWSTLQMYVDSTPTNSSAGVGLRTGNLALTLYTSDSLGNNLEVLDATNAAWRPVRASAFTVGSSERIKENIEPVQVLDKITQLAAKRYQLKVRPQNYRMVDGEEVVVDHDCSIDECAGDGETLCCLAANDTPEYGLVAEDVYEVFPEAVRLGPDLTPDGVDINQLLAIAIGAIVELTARVAELEGR